MTAIDPRIIKFLRRHHVLTLATLADLATGELWACNLFYAYCQVDGKGPCLVFTSGAQTHHAAQFVRHPRVAGSVVLETKVVAKVQGLQLQGTVHRGDEAARSAYLKRFPYAAVLLKELWTLELTRLKYTDNTLGFGTKLHWNKETV